jgi:hypothetical protein
MLKGRKDRIVTLVALVAMAIGSWSFSFWTNAHAGNSRLPGGRARLQVCIQKMDGSEVDQSALGKITAAFAQVKNHKHYEEAGLNSSGGLQIIRGCPSVAAAKLGRSHVVSRPNPIFTFIFVATEAELKDVTFKRYPRTGSQETMCSGDKCNEVTKALYITPEEIEDEATLVKALTAGIGLILPEEEQGTIYGNGVTPDNKTEK